ncbi:unnamed protein product [Sympodiomycopsis kandeliae]
MDTLDLPTHQLILDELALNLSESIQAGDKGIHGEQDYKLLLPTSSSSTAQSHVLTIAAAHSEITLARFAASIASASRSTQDTVDSDNDQHLAPVLEHVINTVGNLTSLDLQAVSASSTASAHNAWPLQDELGYALVKSLLEIASTATQHRNKCLQAVFTFIEKLATALNASTGDAHIVTTRILPLFHGLYRAIVQTTFHWSLSELIQLITILTPLTNTSTLINKLNAILLVLPDQLLAKSQGNRATRRKVKEPTIRNKDTDEADSTGSVDTFFSGDEDDDDGTQNEDTLNAFTFQPDQERMDSDAFAYRYTLLSHYKNSNRPLSGHFILCATLEILSSTLAQSMSHHLQVGQTRQPGHHAHPGRPIHSNEQKHTLPVTAAWQKLHQYPVNFNAHHDIPDGTANGDAPPSSASGGILAAIPFIGTTNGSAAFGSASATDSKPASLAPAVHLASRAYHDIQRFIEREGQKQSQLFPDIYALETLSEALKLGALASIAHARITAASQPDAHTVVRIRALLSEAALLSDPILQGAALQSASILVRNFPALVGSLTTQLRRFVATPQPMFVAQDPSHVPSVLANAAKCLANCVTIPQGDDLAISTMYALLNHLGRDLTNRPAPSGGTAAGGAASVRSGLSRAVTGRDFSMGHSASQTIFAHRNSDEKRVVVLSIIAVVSRLALEINRPEITSLTISMLLQRLRTADDEGESAILYALVPLALAAPKSSFLDVIKAYTQASRNAITGGASRRAGVAIRSAQLQLAQGLARDPNHTDRETASKETSPQGSEDDEDDDHVTGLFRQKAYLHELLQLFTEKGQTLQSATANGSKSEQAELTTDLVGLLPVIAAVVSHPDLHPEVEPSLETVSLFRNLWFLSVIFGLINKDTSPASATALQVISVKTPTLVPESAHNYLETDLQYNSILKREHSSVTLDRLRKSLDRVIPSHTGHIRSLGGPQVTFLATIYHVECTRSSMGKPSMILGYFVNEGLNTSSLVGSMEAIADQVVSSFIDDLSPQVVAHSVDPRVSIEVKKLLLGSCHRVEKVRLVSRRFLDRLFAAFPSLIVDQDVVYTLLETLTLLRRGCEGAYRDEFSPVYHFRSERADVEFDLSDSYSQREEILSDFYTRSKKYLASAMTRAPVEISSILQRYLGGFNDHLLPGVSELGKSVALDFARSIPVTSGIGDAHLPSLGGWKADQSSSFIGEITSKGTYQGEMTGIHLALTQRLIELKKDPQRGISKENLKDLKQQLADITEQLVQAGNVKEAHQVLPLADLRRLLYRSAALAVAAKEADFDLLHFIVAIPLRVLTPEAITVASNVWTWIIGERPVFETKIMVELSIGWGASVKARRGIFQNDFTYKHALLQKTEMSASDRNEIVKENEKASKLFSPHLTLIQLISSRFQAFRYRDPTMVLALVRMLQRSGQAYEHMSTHPLAREARLALVVFGFTVIQSSQLDGLVEDELRRTLYNMAFQWFSVAPQFSFGGNRLQSSSEMQILQELLAAVKADSVKSQSIVTSCHSISSVRLPGHLTLQDGNRDALDRKAVLQLLVEDELRRITVWTNPLNDPSRGSDFQGDSLKSMTDDKWHKVVEIAWRLCPGVVPQLPIRFKHDVVRREAGKLVRSEPHRVFRYGDALSLLAQEDLKLALKEKSDLKWLLYWGAVPPIDAIGLFQPEYGNHAMLLQYAMKALEYHPVELTFFYVPQVVQALRDDQYGYVEQFVFETSKVSQLFCHQILWNMKANSYQDDDGEVPDPMKPTLDRMTSLIVEALTGEAQDFYDREFGFFNEVTSISGKLKPYIKKSKPEKKAKIDEEMGKIKVDAGVYLPSNPDGVVVDLDRKSGRPLQSHAKAPFMATFKVHREVEDDDEKKGVDVWQSAIFKVGDDCRQDVLALQCMAMMKNIFTSVGLDVYVYPYRVTATGPGCGVIDVVPNATSRDEMGRSKINCLLDFFKGMYGNQDSITFQKARLNFIQSMAAYSVACHLLQCRDRHNGNIMIQNDTGHLVHIDFGFLFDIGPGGMHFEPYSFKLTEEFMDVMGGINSYGFKLFCELTVKAFLSVRPYGHEIIQICSLMGQTGLPSFKGPKGRPTMERFKNRFMLDLDDRQAAQHMVKLIKDAAGNRRSIYYDMIQAAQNGIPYHN